MRSKVVIDHFNLLPAIEEEWVKIQNASSAQSPFSSFDYVQMWYTYFAAPEDVRVYCVSVGDKTIGFIPLVVMSNKGFRELHNLYNDHCFNPRPLILNGYEQEFQELLLHQLFKDKQRWDLFRHGFSYSFSTLPGLFSDDQLIRAHVRWTKKREPTYSILLNKSFEEYVKIDLTANMRSYIKKRRKKLANAENHSFLHYQGSEAIKYWSHFLEIEGSGWKGAQGSSINKTDTCVQIYYEKLLLILADYGVLHLYFLNVGDKAIAAGFGYSESEVFHYAKIGYDEEYQEFSPSNILQLHVIERMMTESHNIKRFHLFPWDYGYKHRFINEQSECIETIIYSPTVRGNLAYALILAKMKLGEKLPEIIDHARKLWKQLGRSKTDSCLSSVTKENPVD